MATKRLPFDFNQNERLKIIGFNIDYTILVERDITGFIYRYEFEHKKGVNRRYQSIAKKSFNEKIIDFEKIIAANTKLFGKQVRLIRDIRKVKKLRNHLCHDAFSVSDKGGTCRFLTPLMQVVEYKSSVIKEHWKRCRSIHDRLISLNIKTTWGKKKI